MYMQEIAAISQIDANHGLSTSRKSIDYAD